mmetsp:Transcript_7854/g.12163  ORF Transcript_7854/g.12163 Transcript_7854/m.12163 type:complete len:103 (+) Transcript_7854:1271-1579(+)
MEMFYRVNSLGFPQTHPHFFGIFKRKISAFLEDQETPEDLQQKQHPCDPPGIFCPHSPNNHLNTDLDIEVNWFMKGDKLPENVRYLVEDFVFGCRFCRHLAT